MYKRFFDFIRVPPVRKISYRVHKISLIRRYRLYMDRTQFEVVPGKTCNNMTVITENCWKRAFDETELKINKADFYNLFFVEATVTKLPSHFSKVCKQEKHLDRWSNYRYNPDLTSSGCYVADQEPQFQDKYWIMFDTLGDIPYVQHTYGRKTAEVCTEESYGLTDYGTPSAIKLFDENMENLRCLKFENVFLR